MSGDAFLKRRSWRATAFVLGHVAALALIYVVFIAPMIDFFQNIQDEVDSKKSNLAKIRESYVRLIETPRAEATQDNATAAQYLTGGNEGAVAAALLGNLKNLVDPTGVSLRSVRPMQGRDIGKLTALGARIEIAGDMPAMVRALHNIESSNAPALFVESAILRVLPGGAPSALAPPQMEGQFDVYGVLRERSPS